MDERCRHCDCGRQPGSCRQFRGSGVRCASPAARRAFWSRKELRRSATQTLLDRYQEPLVRSAFDLQSRLYNILERDLLGTGATESRLHREKHGVATRSVLWLGRDSAARGTVPCPSHGRRSRESATAARAIARACSSDSLGGGDQLQIQRSEQRALGEVMVIEGRDAARRSAIGLSRLCRLLRGGGRPRLTRPPLVCPLVAGGVAAWRDAECSASFTCSMR